MGPSMLTSQGRRSGPLPGGGVIDGAKWSPGKRAGPLPVGGVIAGANWDGLVLVGVVPLKSDAPGGNPRGAFAATFVPGDAPVADADDCPGITCGAPVANAGDCTGIPPRRTPAAAPASQGRRAGPLPGGGVIVG